MSARMLLISVWSDAVFEKCPGGMCGASRKPIRRSATMASATQMITARLMWCVHPSVRRP